MKFYLHVENESIQREIQNWRKLRDANAPRDWLLHSAIFTKKLIFPIKYFDAEEILDAFDKSFFTLYKLIKKDYGKSFGSWCFTWIIRSSSLNWEGDLDSLEQAEQVVT